MFGRRRPLEFAIHSQSRTPHPGDAPRRACQIPAEGSLAPREGGNPRGMEDRHKHWGLGPSRRKLSQHFQVSPPASSARLPQSSAPVASQTPRPLTMCRPFRTHPDRLSASVQGRARGHPPGVSVRTSEMPTRRTSRHSGSSPRPAPRQHPLTFSSPLPTLTGPSPSNTPRGALPPGRRACHTAGGPPSGNCSPELST